MHAAALCALSGENGKFSLNSWLERSVGKTRRSCCSPGAWLSVCAAPSPSSSCSSGLCSSLTNRRENGGSCEPGEDGAQNLPGVTPSLLHPQQICWLARQGSVLL